MSATENIFTAHGFGKVSPWVDLVNSEEWDGFGQFSDRLDDPSWRDAFLRHWKLQPAANEKMPLQRLRSLRTLLRGIAESLAAQRSPSTRDIAELNAILSVPVRQQLAHDQNGLHTELQPVRTNWNAVLSRIAASAADSIVAGEAARIRICANEDCRWAFRDPTKAGTKRWCSDRTCGNRDRVRRSRAASR
jgi:predicted RNA-binding Zn ribbon-like protein